MRVFLDTEFTDFANPRLISIGLAAENGDEFYAVIKDGWMIEQCSPFVIDVVLPFLHRSDAKMRPKIEAGSLLSDWLSKLDNGVSVVYDAAVDWQLMLDLLRSHKSSSVNIESNFLFCDADRSRIQTLNCSANLMGDSLAFLVNANLNRCATISHI